MNRRQLLGGLVAAPLAAVTGGSLRTERSPSPCDLFNRLSPREREVLTLRANGWSKAMVRRELLISQHTLNVFTENILTKLDVRSELAAIALRTKVA